MAQRKETHPTRSHAASAGAWPLTSLNLHRSRAERTRRGRLLSHVAPPFRFNFVTL